MMGCGRDRLLTLLTLLCGLLPGRLNAQTPPLPAAPVEMTVPSDANGLMTLHAYSNLIQMPVLVLSPGMIPVGPIKPEKFTLSIDNGPWYRPTHVRLEGTDPISLTIVLDFPGNADELMPKISQGIDRLMPQGLTARDHVSLLIMQCKLYDALQDVPAEPGLLEPKIALAVARWAERSRMKHPPPCEEKWHLWDTLAIATSRLGELPGRRVIVAVTDGVDRGSRESPRDVAVAMQSRAVTTFALRPYPPGSNGIGSGGGLGGGRSRVPFVQQAVMSGVIPDEPLERLCELSGGISLSAGSWDSGKQLALIPGLVRGRYILEFPRPWNSTAGTHAINVQVEKSLDFIRPSGTAVPLPDPERMADPTTLHSDPSLTPQMGKKKTPPPS